VECLPQCCKIEAAKFPPTTSGQHVLDMYAAANKGHTSTVRVAEGWGKASRSIVLPSWVLDQAQWKQGWVHRTFARPSHAGKAHVKTSHQVQDRKHYDPEMLVTQHSGRQEQMCLCLQGRTTFGGAQQDAT